MDSQSLEGWWTYVEVYSASWQSSNIVSAAKAELLMPGCRRESRSWRAGCACKCM